MDFQQNLHSSHASLFLGNPGGGSSSNKRKRILKPASSSSESSSESDDEPDNDDFADVNRAETSSYRIPKKGRRIWDSKQMENLRKNFKNIENIDDSVLAFISFREISSNEGKKDKQSRVLTEKLAENYDRIRKFPSRVEAGEDSCTDKAHDARFLRGYVGNSQELWIQARRKLGVTGLDPISSYETVSTGLNGFVSERVWHEIHSPSSKHLSIRMLTSHALKSVWSSSEKGGEVKEFDSMHDLRMAVVALEACTKKVYWWNSSVTTIAIFLHTIEFGEIDLAAYSDKLTILADFIDEILKFNAQAWDEERFFMSAQDITSKWSALLVRKNVAHASKPSATGSRKKPENSSGSSKVKERVKYPPNVCKLFNKGTCTHSGDKHSAPWNPNYVLKHCCTKFVQAKNEYCMEQHAAKDHK